MPNLLKNSAMCVAITVFNKRLFYFTNHLISRLLTGGEVSEWLIEPVSKTGVFIRVPQVRIPLSSFDFFMSFSGLGAIKKAPAGFDKVPLK